MSAKQRRAGRGDMGGSAGRARDGTNRTTGLAANPKAVWAFVGGLIGWYLGLLLLWLPLGPAYRDGLIGAGNMMLGSLFSGKEIVFQHHTEWQSVGVPERADVAVLVRTAGWKHQDGRKQYVLAKPVATFYQPFTASVFLAALFLTSRLSWWVRLRKGILAMIALHGLMLASVLVDVDFTFGQYRENTPGLWSWVMTAVRLLHSSVTDWPAGVYLVPLLIWVTFCRHDLLVGPVAAVRRSVMR